MHRSAYRVLRTAYLFALPLLAACGDGTGPDSGPVALALENNHQRAASGAAQFDQPVVGKAVITGTARTGFRFQLVTPAYADTTLVQGAPAAGVDVCIIPERDGPDLPTSEYCKRTGRDGLVSFTFSPGTREGRYVYRPYMNLADGSRVDVQDSVVFEVVAQPPTSTGLEVGRTFSPHSSVTDTSTIYLHPNLFTREGGAPASYRVEASGWLAVRGDTLGTTAARALYRTRAVAPGDTATIRFHSAWKVVAEARATYVESPYEGWILDITPTRVDVP